MKVVVADDSRAMRMIVIRTLRQAGYDGADITECENGAEGNQVAFGFVTSEGSDAMRQQAADSGALFLIAKPFTADMFADALKPVLG